LYPYEAKTSYISKSRLTLQFRASKTEQRPVVNLRVASANQRNITNSLPITLQKLAGITKTA
jgi:hypothetical protein